MKQRFSVAATVLMLLLASSVYAQNDKNFRITPAVVKPGDTILIAYNPAGTPLEGLAPVTGAIALYRNFSWEMQDLNMKMTDSGWAARYVVPAGTALISCKFSSGKKTDRGGKDTYSWMLMQDKEKQQPGAFAGWAFLRASGYGYNAPNIVEDSARITDTVGLYWMNVEVKNNPASQRKIFFRALALLKSVYGKQADSTIISTCHTISSMPDVTEKELMDVWLCFKQLLYDKQRADSMQQLIIKKYPLGQAAWDRDMYKVFEATNADIKDSLWKLFKTRFPLKEHMFPTSYLADLFYSKAYSSVVYSQIIFKNNYAVLDELLPTAPILTLIDFHRNIVENPLTRIDGQYRTPAFLLPYSTLIIHQIEESSKISGWPESKMFTPSEWQQLLQTGNADAFKTHAFVLEQTGDAANAMVYADKVKGVFKYSNAAFNELYVRLLQKNGRQREVKPYLELSVKENAATPEMITVLKQLYTAEKRPEAGFDAYFTSLKSKDKVLEQKANIKSHFLQWKTLPEIKLESNKGGFVDLSAQKGKIVVIDFWATWCAPCKAAMPGMQMVMNKYRNDPKVAFYFIATMEKNKDYKKVIADFLAAQHFDFNVLYDNKPDKSGNFSDAFYKFGKPGYGIPQKWIIDETGTVRWFADGYNGSPSELADEINYVIELLKAEKKQAVTKN